VTHVKSIKTANLKSINLEIGISNIFRDLKKCDHVIYFKDIVKDEELTRVSPSKFPLQLYYPRVKRRLCQICDHHFARVVVKKDKNSPYSINYYCMECFRDLHLE
jgi:snRNA-activating protein complex (SNAPc), subunit 3